MFMSKSLQELGIGTYENIATVSWPFFFVHYDILHC